MIVYGFNPVLEAIRSHPERIRWVGVAREEKGKVARILESARNAGVPVRRLPREEIGRLAGQQVHNNVVAEIAGGGYADFDDVLTETTRFVLILDGIQDPQNLGAILRVADGFGVDFVILPEHETAGLSSGAIKASAGASQWVPVVQVTNLARTLDRLKESGFWTYAAAMEGQPVWKVDFEGKVAVVLGNEAKGIRQNVLAHCDATIAIPMRGHVNSLNVATAAAVIAYEIVRQDR
ncbi:MAG TPA: 23S rRNA (guanosine(2251)-2'-O)-methyltransferase RlmB [Thermoanaerobaculia bacterium]|nr:23S rRNA (guanosine(2251)-2'-O)-methyltransferase RlmB [Thermoanaerobaculia bacterium]